MWAQIVAAAVSQEVTPGIIDQALFMWRLPSGRRRPIYLGIGTSIRQIGRYKVMSARGQALSLLLERRPPVPPYGEKPQANRSCHFRGAVVSLPASGV